MPVKPSTDEWVEDPVPAARSTAGDEWEEEGAAAPKPGKKSFLGGLVQYDPEKNDFANKGVLKTLGSELTKEPDQSAKALFQTLGYAGGLASDAGIEALKRFTGHGGLGAEEWKKALHGNATPATEQLKEAGYGPLVSYGVGLPYGAVTDPLSGMFGMKSAATAGASELPSAARPVSTAMQALAKKIYGAPFKKVDAELATKYRNAGGKAHAFTDQLWNEGNPIAGGFSKTNPEIGEQITKARKAAGRDIGNRIQDAGGDAEIHLAPDLIDRIQREMPKEAPELTAQQAKAISFLPPDVQEAAKQQTLAAAVTAPKGDPVDFLKNLIKSKDKAARAQGIRILADSSPQLASVIEGNAKHLANSGSRPGMIAFYDGLIDDIAEGPRSLEGLQDLKISMQDAAARNQQMGGNQYARNALPNKSKSAEMQAASDLGKVIDGIVDNHLGASAASAGDKAKYSALRRGEIPAWRAVQSAENKPFLGTLGKFAGALALFNHDPKVLAAALATKGLDLLHSSPRVATGTGMLLNKASKNNIWDAMVRKGLLNSVQGKGENQ